MCLESAVMPNESNVNLYGIEKYSLSIPQSICYWSANYSLVYNLFAPKCNLLGHSGAE